MSAPAVVATGADVAKNAANPVLALKEADLKMMLAAKVHLGTKNADPQVRAGDEQTTGDGEQRKIEPAAQCLSGPLTVLVFGFFVLFLLLFRLTATSGAVAPMV